MRFRRSQRELADIDESDNESCSWSSSSDSGLQGKNQCVDDILYCSTNVNG